MGLMVVIVIVMVLISLTGLFYLQLKWLADRQVDSLNHIEPEPLRYWEARKELNKLEREDWIREFKHLKEKYNGMED